MYFVDIFIALALQLTEGSQAMPFSVHQMQKMWPEKEKAHRMVFDATNGSSIHQIRIDWALCQQISLNVEANEQVRVDVADNLRPDRYDDFVFYLTEVVRWYRDTHGLIFRHVLTGCIAKRLQRPHNDP